MLRPASSAVSDRLVSFNLILVLLFAATATAQTTADPAAASADPAAQSPLDTYLHQPMFWLKMVCVAALMLNGAWLVRASGQALGGHVAAWTALRGASIASLVLWFGTTLLGAALPNVL